MSGAIWGIISFNKSNKSFEELGQVMKLPLEKYKIDRFNTKIYKNVFMGYAAQYITLESRNEVLPFVDEELMITADAILDNRDELGNLLCLSKDEIKRLSDSEYILRAYKKWGKDCSQYLLGDFAFVIWDNKKQEVYCARDQVGSRTLYYYYDKEIFAFSTVEEPILQIMNEITLNKEWISNFINTKEMLHDADATATAYKDIRQVPAANIMIVNGNKSESKKYWNPLDNIKLKKYKARIEYEREFLKLYTECVRCRLRTDGEVGVLVSGGLDSSSVACIAAQIQKFNNKKINGYTSVPFKEFKGEVPKGRIADESEYVNSMVDEYKNLKVKFCDSDGIDCLSEIDNLLNIFEQPYKIVENAYWYNNLVSISAKDGCKVILNGQFGNCTVSYGNFATYAATMINEKRYFSFISELFKFSRVYGVSKKDILNTLKNNKISTVDDYHRQITSDLIFSHIGACECKISLANGIQLRDPTKDKRLIEFILSLPIEAFVNNGIERYLVRSSLKGIVPDKILNNLSKKGYQSADWIQRIQPKLEDIKNEIYKVIEDNKMKELIDSEKIRELVDSVLTEPIDYRSSYKVKSIIQLIILNRFINNANSTITLKIS